MIKLKYNIYAIYQLYTVYIYGPGIWFKCLFLFWAKFYCLFKQLGSECNSSEKMICYLICLHNPPRCKSSVIHENKQWVTTVRTIPLKNAVWHKVILRRFFYLKKQWLHFRVSYNFNNLLATYSKWSRIWSLKCSSVWFPILPNLLGPP